MSDLAVSMRIQLGSEWIELQDPAYGYELHADTLASRSVQHKKVTVESNWLEGSYTHRPRRENVVETLAVYCTGLSHGEMQRNLDTLTMALDQANFLVDLRMEDHREVWYCQTADYSIETSRELMVAKHAIVKAQVPRLPTKAA